MSRTARLVAALLALLAFAGLVYLFLPERAAPAGEPAREPSRAEAPERLSAADAEAQLAAREALASAHDPTRVPGAAPPDASAAPAAPAARADAALTVSTRILDPTWRPIAGARLAWLAATPDLRIGVKREARADATGAAWLALGRDELAEALGGGTPLLLAASAPGHLRLTRSVRSAELTGPVLNLGEWVLAAGGDVAGRVVDARGDPVTGALVRLAPELGEASEREREMARLWPVGGDVGVPGLLPLDTTDALGRFTLAGVPTGRFDVVAAVLDGDPPRLPARATRVLVRPGETTDVGLLVLADVDPEELVTGRVLDPDGLPVAGALVSLGTQHVVHPGRTRSTLAGRFALPAPREDGLLAGASDPEQRWAPSDRVPARAGGPEIELRFTHAASAAAGGAAPPTQQPTERPPGDARVRGRFTLDGAPAHGWTASLGPRRSALDHDGAFELDRIRLRAEDRLVLATRPGGVVMRTYVEPLALASGDNEWSRDLATGTLVLENLPPAAPARGAEEVDWPEYALECSLGAGTWTALLQETPDARVELAGVPRGRLVLRWRAEGSAADDPSGWPVATELELSGARTTVRVP